MSQASQIISCPSCQAKMRVAELGKTYRCPKCATEFQVGKPKTVEPQLVSPLATNRTAPTAKRTAPQPQAQMQPSPYLSTPMPAPNYARHPSAVYPSAPKGGISFGKLMLAIFAGVGAFVVAGLLLIIVWRATATTPQSTATDTTLAKANIPLEPTITPPAAEAISSPISSPVVAGPETTTEPPPTNDPPVSVSVTPDSLPLRYRWDTDGKFAYDVSIFAVLPRSEETLTGKIIYTAKSTTDPAKVTYLGGLSKSSKSTVPEEPRGPFGPPNMFGSGMMGMYSQRENPFKGLERTSNEIELTASGEVLSLQGDSQLPYMLGNLSLLVFEPLPASRMNEWTIDGGVTISERSERPTSRFGMGGMGGMGSPFMQQGQSKPDKTTTASEITTYVKQEEVGDLDFYQRKFRLQTPSDGGSFIIEGDGRWAFNRRLGMSESFDGKQNLQISKDNVSITIPVTVKYHRIAYEEWERIENERKAKDAEFIATAERKRKADAEKKAEATAPVSKADRDTSLIALRSNNAKAITTVLEHMKNRPPKETDNEFVTAVQKLLKHKERAVREPAHQLLLKWSPEYAAEAVHEAAYKGGSVKPSGLKVTPTTPLYVGQILTGKWHSQWHVVEIIAVNSDGTVKIHYRGEGSNWDEGMTRDNLQLAPPGLFQPAKNP